MAQRIISDGFQEIPILAVHSLEAGTLPGEHRDPFDRMIAAQSILEKLAVVTNDKEIENFGAELLW